MQNILAAFYSVELNLVQKVPQNWITEFSFRDGARLTCVLDHCHECSSENFWLVVDLADSLFYGCNLVLSKILLGTYFVPYHGRQRLLGGFNVWHLQILTKSGTQLYTSRSGFCRDLRQTLKTRYYASTCLSSIYCLFIKRLSYNIFFALISAVLSLVWPNLICVRHETVRRRRRDNLFTRYPLILAALG